MATRTRYKATLKNPNTGEVRVIVPDLGITLTPGGLANLSALAYVLWNNQGVVSNCITTPPVEPGAPVWRPDYAPNNAVRGYEYVENIYWALAGTPAAGQTITSVELINGPAWLSAARSISEGKTIMRGNYPAGTTSFIVYLSLYQGDGRATTKRFTISVGLAQPYVHWIYQSNGALVVYVGPNGTGNPTTTLINAPAGYGYIDTYSMAGVGSPAYLDTKVYYFSFVYPNIIAGSYTDVISWFDQSFSYTLNLTPGNYGEGVAALTPVESISGGMSDEADYAVGASLNNPPVVNTAQPDVTITTAGAYSFTLPADEFLDPGDTKALTAFKYDGGTRTQYGLPAGVSFDAATRTVIVAADFANQAFVVWIVCTDSAGQSVVDDFLLTINRASPVNTYVTKVDYAWQKNTPPSVLSNSDFYFGSSDNSALEYAIAISGGDTIPKSNYLSTTAGSYGTGYSRKDSIAMQSGNIVTLYIRKVGTTTDLKVITLPVLPQSGTVPRTNAFSA